VANICKRPGKAGILVGSHRYRCQDLNEMSFRSLFREHAREFTVLEALTTLEDPRYAAELTRELLAQPRSCRPLYGGKLAIAHPVAALAQTTVAAMAVTTEGGSRDAPPRHLLPFDLLQPRTFKKVSESVDLQLLLAKHRCFSRTRTADGRC
jgi:hypothetical protein